MPRSANGFTAYILGWVLVFVGTIVCLTEHAPFLPVAAVWLLMVAVPGIVEIKRHRVEVSRRDLSREARERLIRMDYHDFHDKYLWKYDREDGSPIIWTVDIVWVLGRYDVMTGERDPEACRITCTGLSLTGKYAYNEQENKVTRDSRPKTISSENVI